MGVRSSRGYDLIRQRVFPRGVVVQISERQLRFNEERLRDWIEAGGAFAVERSSNGEGKEQREVYADENK